MKYRIFLAILAIGIFGLLSVAPAATNNNEFNSRKKIVESILDSEYTGPENIGLSASEKELNDSWIPEGNRLIERENILKGSYVKNLELNSDGSIKLNAYIGQGIKNIVKIPFFSTVSVTFKPLADNGQLRIELMKIKLGFFSINPAVAQKLASRWADLNSPINLKPFTLDKITVTDTDLTIAGRYQNYTKANYSCNAGKSIEAFLFKGQKVQVKPGQMPVPTGRARVTLGDGQRYELKQTISADGGRYANSDESIIFWDKGDTAKFFDHGKEKAYVGCKLVK